MITDIEIAKDKTKEIQQIMKPLKEIITINRNKRIFKNNEINQFNPMSIGDKAIGNESSYNGKEFLIDSVFVGSINKIDLNCLEMFPINIDKDPVYFIASGRLVKRDNSLSHYRTSRVIRIDSILTE